MSQCNLQRSATAADLPDLPNLADLCDVQFDNSFVRELPGDTVTHNVPRAVRNACYTRVDPTPVRAPRLLAWADPVGEMLGISRPASPVGPAVEVLGGNRVLPGMQPYAARYGGHQFGHWAGQLGDGRAMLLGALTTPENREIEVQLKGAGRTPYSRGGDGRAVLRSSIREFLCSEAMHSLGIPTTRALSVIGSDAPIYREVAETAAVVTRTAPSFIRFGHFEHFCHNNLHAELKQLADFVIDHHYPVCRHSDLYAGNPYAALLAAVSERTARMVAQWQAVGFCHGVMNTDNMSILGLTIDYGPFQFLDAFNPGHICNHTDSLGRYAYNKQPNVAYWNLFCLGQALLPLIDDQELALAALEPYKTIFPAALEAQMRTKLGLTDVQPHDRALVESIQKLLTQDKVDYTLFWRNLSHTVGGAALDAVRNMFIDRPAFDAWMLQYSERIRHINRRLGADLMLKTNPKYVLRNYLGEEAIAKAKLKDFSGVEALLTLLQAPFDEHPGFEAYAGLPPDWASEIEISCSS